MPTDSEMMASRLEAIKEAHKRVRLSFFLVIAAAAIILSGVFTSSISWDHFATRHNQLNTKDWDKEIDPEVEKERRKLLLSDHYLSIPLLGIRVATSDLPLIGSITLLVLCFYYCSCTRLANQEISSVLTQNRAGELTVKQFIYFTIRSSMFLNNPSLDGAPITRLELSEYRSVVRRSIPRAFRAMRCLPYLPLATIIVSVGADVLEALGTDYRGRNPLPATWTLVSAAAKVQFISTDVIAVLCGLFVLSFVRAAIRYNDASVLLMEEFRADLWK